MGFTKLALTVSCTVVCGIPIWGEESWVVSSWKEFCPTAPLLRKSFLNLSCRSPLPLPSPGLGSSTFSTVQFYSCHKPQLSPVAVGDSHSHKTVPMCLGNHNLFCLHGYMKRWFPVRGKCILYQCQLHKMDIANYNEPNGS